jgi:hypothetical protein
MTVLKNNWQNGEQWNASNQNDLADEVNGKYVKPALGVPITDLTTTVQLSLGKADTAVQSVASADITDSTSTGRAVLKATDASTARTAIGVAYGTTAGTVCQGNDSRLTPSSTSITDSTATGRSLLTAADAPAARTTLGVAYGTAAGTVCQGNDSRLSDSRTPTTAGQVADLSIVAFGSGTARAVGTGDFPFGVKLQRAVTFTSVTYRVATADASGSLVVELRKNGVAVAGSSSTIAAASQVSGGTATGTWAFATGDIITVRVTAIGTTPGKGLIADVQGLTT